MLQGEKGYRLYRILSSIVFYYITHIVRMVERFLNLNPLWHTLTHFNPLFDTITYLLLEGIGYNILRVCHYDIFF